MDVQNELNRAVQAINSGDLAEARLLLKHLIDINPRNVRAWELMAEIVTDPKHVALCLERVLKYDPQNETARQKLAVLQGQPVAVQVGSPVIAESKATEPPATAEPLPVRSTTQKKDPRPAKKSKGSLGLLEIFLIFAVGISACCVIGLLLVTSDSFDLGVQAPAPTQSASDITAVMYRNIYASNDEDIDLYMSTIHSDSPGYNDTKDLLNTAFGEYDLSYFISDVEVIKQNSRQAEVAFVLTTRKIRGPDFRDNRVTGTMILRVEDGVWKIYDQDVDNIDYLN
jgi:hypothetical protein